MIIKPLYIKAILFRLILFSITWWSFTHNNTDSWAVGIPIILASLLASLKLIPPIEFRPLALLRFSPFFLLHSFLGGIDVARRVLRKQCDIDPVMIRYTCHLPEGIPVFFMLCIINLLPGTLSVVVENHKLTIHILNGKSDYQNELNQLLQHVSRIYHLNISSECSGPAEIEQCT